MKKIARQEDDLRIAYDEIEKEERLHKVSNLTKTLVGVKAEREMVDFGEMMSCLEITMRKESRLEDYKAVGKQQTPQSSISQGKLWSLVCVSILKRRV